MKCGPQEWMDFFSCKISREFSVHLVHPQRGEPWWQELVQLHQPPVDGTLHPQINAKLVWKAWETTDHLEKILLRIHGRALSLQKIPSFWALQLPNVALKNGDSLKL